jgi:dipeptidyl aminopeptidase/acylaminoacyl peptidase
MHFFYIRSPKHHIQIDMKRFFPVLLISLALTACEPTNITKNNAGKAAEVIGPVEAKLESDILNPELLWAMGRLGEYTISPDGSLLLFTITYYNLEQNKGNSDLYVMGIDGKELTRITETASGEYNPRWRPDGKKIGYLTAAGGSMQLWEMNPDGTERKQITELSEGINGFEYAPDQSKILFISEVKIGDDIHDMHPDLPKASGRIMDDLMYRHWDHWVETFSHVFVADYSETGISNIQDIMPGEPWESPVRPWGGMEQIAWSPDSQSLVYTARKKTGKAYSESTNTDLYLYNLITKVTTNLTEGMMGYDNNPVFSPDGKQLAWESMERDGFEADKVRLMVMNLESGEKKNYSVGFDQDAHHLSWSSDSKSIWFVSNWHALDQVYHLELKNGSIKKITEGTHSYTTVHAGEKALIGTRMSMSAPVELFSIDPETGQETQLTFINKPLLDQLTMGKVEARWMTTTDNKKMLTWVIYPPHFDPQKKYPAILYCQGGPQSTVSQFWSYRWNLQLMAANNYIIVAPNRRGLPGFGSEWNEQISGDYGGQNMKDYLTAIDEMAMEPYVDETRLGAVGASYGGFSVYWLAGNHNKRFKAFIAHNGMFNLESQYLETEEMWFVNWDLGGPFWEKDNKVAQWSYANSPHRFVQNWDTPILVIHSELDYRIVASQGMQAFNAAKLKGVPARYLYFPDENHWVLKPQNSVLWQRTFFGWLDQWLK